MREEYRTLRTEVLMHSDIVKKISSLA